jgi:DNA-binding NarL/FixJ family response regulator
MHDVVIAEDHPLFREALAGVLSSMPEIGTIHQAANGQQALLLVQVHQPALAILDIRMPEIDGMAVTAELQQKHPAVRVLIISTTNSTTLVRQGLEKGAHGFLLKDADSEEIRQAVRALLSGDTYLSAQLAQALAMERLRPDSKPKLTPREQQIIQLLCKERTSLQIANELCVSERTIERLRSEIIQKIGAHNTVGIVKYAMTHGLLEE